MSWDYRVTKQRFEGEDLYEIREVYYDANGRVDMWTVDPVGPSGDSLAELEQSLGLMTDALKRGIVDLDQLNAISLRKARR